MQKAYSAEEIKKQIEEQAKKMFGEDADEIEEEYIKKCQKGKSNQNSKSDK